MKTRLNTAGNNLTSSFKKKTLLMKQCVPAHKWVSLQNKMFIFFDKNFRYVGFILGLILYTQCDNMLPSVLALLISSISLLLIFHAKIILSAVFLPSMVSGHHQQHHHPQHDLHQNLPEVWPVGRQPGQHCLRPGLLHWAAAATGTCTCMHTHAHTHTHTHTPTAIQKHFRCSFIY